MSRIVPSVRLVAITACVCGALFSARASADYSNDFEGYADGQVPPGWVNVYGPGIMGVTAGTFAQRSTAFSNFCFYEYSVERFGEATFDLDVNVSSVAWNNTIIWRWDGIGDGGSGSVQLVFRTSPLIPPTEKTRLYLFTPSGGSVLAESPDAYVGLHHVTILDEGLRFVVKVDGALLFDVNPPAALTEGYFAVNPGDWGGGGFYDNMRLVSARPTAVRQSTWGSVKRLYSAR